MSFLALAAVSTMRAGSAAEKLIALAYADRHNEETGCAYPSVAWLCEFGSLNRKTVIAAVTRLETAGFLTDTGERKGDTKQIKVYRLNLESIPKAEPFRKRNRTESGTVPKTTSEQSQKRDTDTVKEPTSPKASPSPKRPRSSAPKAQPARMPADWKHERFGEGTVAREVVERRGQDWARAALESFRNWAANADDRSGVGRKLDWQAAWANWIIKQDKDDGQRSGQRVAGNDRGGASGNGRGTTVAAADRFLARRGIGGASAGG